jgi:hypothetical protein
MSVTRCKSSGKTVANSLQRGALRGVNAPITRRNLLLRRQTSSPPLPPRKTTTAISWTLLEKKKRRKHGEERLSQLLRQSGWLRQNTLLLSDGPSSLPWARSHPSAVWEEVFPTLTPWSRSLSKCYLRIQSVPQREHHTSPLQRSNG